MSEVTSINTPTNLSELAQYIIDDLNVYFEPYHNRVLEFHWDIDYHAGWLRDGSDDGWQGAFTLTVLNDPRPFDVLNATQRTRIRILDWIWSCRLKSGPVITPGYELRGEIQIYVNHWREQFMTDTARINHLLLHPGTPFQLEDGSHFTYKEDQDVVEHRASHAH